MKLPPAPIAMRLPLAMLLCTLLTACEIPGLGPEPEELQRIADGKAIGAACRHALRGIEDCYVLNPKASKTAIYDGWRDMDIYMRDNKLEGQKPTVIAQAKAEEIEEDFKPAKKSKAKH